MININEEEKKKQLQWNAYSNGFWSFHYIQYIVYNINIFIQQFSKNRILKEYKSCYKN